MLKRVNSASQSLCIFFQIDFEIIRIMRSKDFNFGFTEDISKFMIFWRTMKKLEAGFTRYIEFA